MRCSLRRILPILILAMPLLLTACQVPLPYLPPSVLEAAVMASDTIDSDPVEEQAVAETDAVEVSGSEESSDEVSDEVSDGSDQAEDDSSVAVEGPVAEEAPEAEEAPAADAASEESDAESQPFATILTRSLRVRSGPGSEYDVVGGASAGERFAIIDAADGCTWLNVQHPVLGAVWISGLPEYTSLSTACEAVRAGVAARQQPPAEAAAEQDDSSADVTAQDEASEDGAPETEADVFPADQGCFLIQNQLGPALNITVTAQERDWQDNFQVAPDQELPYCLSPGSYTVFIDAPAPWSDLNDQLIVSAGDRYFWPIRAGE